MRVTGRVILRERERERDCGSGFRLKRRTEEEEEEEEWQKESLNPTNFTIYVMAGVKVEFGGASQGIFFLIHAGWILCFEGFVRTGFDWIVNIFLRVYLS